MTTERRSKGSEGHAPWTDSEEASVRDLVRWPGPTWSDVNSTVLLDYLAGALATLDVVRLAAQPAAGEGLDVERLAEALYRANMYDPASQYADIKRQEVRDFARDIAAEYAALQPASEDPG